MKRWQWALIFLVAIGLRLFVASLGHTSDTYAFLQTGRFVADGEIVYAVYRKYNYGPIWSYVLAGIVEVMSLFGKIKLFNFHLVVVGVLSVADIAIAIWLLKRAGTVVALVFLFNPVSILLTGYHSQFDTIPLLLALLAWDLLVAKRLIAGSLLLGLSLATKHIFFLFPIWTLFVSSIGSLKQRLLIPIIAYGCFALSFVPFLLNEQAREGIVKNVLLYSSRWRGNSLLYSVTSPIIELLNIPTPVYTSLIKFMFMGGLITLGIVCAYRMKIKDFALWYAVSLLICTSAVAHHYLAIPLAVCALYYRSMWVWAYIGFTVLLLATSKNNIGSLETFGDWQVRGAIPTAIIQMTLVALMLWDGGILQKNRYPS